jgi:hypothetical protein
MKKEMIIQPALLLLLLFTGSCRKFVTVNPPGNQLSRATVFEDNLTATSAVSFLYTDLSSGSGSLNSITYLGGILADEATLYSSNVDLQQLYTNNIVSTNGVISGFWGSYYSDIYKLNAVIEGLNNSANVTASVKTELEGEAKFLRAFLHLYMVSLYGDIPYITTTDFTINTKVSRMPRDQVFQQIVADLKDAQQKLQDGFGFSNGERVKPGKWAATALLARAYLYNNNWADAETQATAVINNTSLFGLVSPDQVFLKNSREAIWQLKPLSSSVNTNEGNIFILTTTPTNSALRAEFISAFEPGDNRRTNWVGSITAGSSTYYFPYKYKIKTGGTPLNEYSMVLRLGEQYLIRAEARAQQNKISEAQADINMIRTRAGLSSTAAADKASLLSAVEKERRIELFSEWGHRWIDLRRTGRIDAVMSTAKAGWLSTDALFPIPYSELLVNPNMTQNPGYN